MNTKDRECMERLNNSLTLLSAKIDGLILNQFGHEVMLKDLSEKLNFDCSKHQLKPEEIQAWEERNERPEHLVPVIPSPRDYNTNRDTPEKVKLDETRYKNLPLTPSEGSGVFQANKTGKRLESETPQNPVQVKPRSNLFVDDGSLHRDEENITPRVALSPRDRVPAREMITEVTCQKCHGRSKVASAHARDYFICDSCITGKKSRG